jgi:prepilin-type N-terminal cleavage/methylation domain-containing protein
MSRSDGRERSRGASRVRGARSGFTLIEVLAAVALLGILYAVLARVAIEGLRAEGDSERRLEASLLADASVDALNGVALPTLGHSETASGDFSIAIDVTAFEIPPQWGVGETQESKDAKPAKPLLLTSAPGGGTPALRTVQVTVSWLEGASPHHVSRTTYLLDFHAVAELAAAAPTPQSPAAAGANGNEPAPSELDLGEPNAPEAR